MYSGQSIVYIFFHVLLELSMNFVVQPGSLPGVVWSLLQILHFSTILDKRLWTSFWVSFLPLIQCWNIFDVYRESCPFTFFLFLVFFNIEYRGKGDRKKSPYLLSKFVWGYFGLRNSLKETFLVRKLFLCLSISQ